MGNRARNIEIAAKAALFLSFFVFVHLFVTSRIARYEGIKADHYKIQDFHYYIVVIKSFWQNEIPSIYDPRSQLAAMAGYFGAEVTHAMPLGISPTALLIMLPFTIVARAGFSLANTLWVSVSVTLFAAAVRGAYSYLLASRRDALPPFLLAVCIFLFSFRTVSVIFLGQASLMACALLLFLVLEMVSAKEEGRAPRRWLVVPAVFVLSMKMHYFALGAGILLFGGCLAELVISLFVVGLSLMFLFAYAGPVLMTGFVGQISLFSAAELPDITGVFHSYITFRSAFAPIIGESPSLVISAFVLLAGGVAIVWITASRTYGLGKRRKIFDGATTQRITIALFALLLLFLPYIGGYEDLLLFIPFAIVFSMAIPVHGTYGTIMWVMPFLFIVLNHDVLFPAEYLWLFWTMKTFVLSYLMFFGKEPMMQKAVAACAS